MTDVTGVNEFAHIQNADPDENGIIERPVIPLTDTVIFPGVISPIRVSSEQTLAAIKFALAANQTAIGLAQLDPLQIDPIYDDFYRMGTEMAIGSPITIGPAVKTALGEGRRRVEVVELTQADPFIVVKARLLPEKTIDAQKASAMMQAVLDLFRHRAELSDTLPEEVVNYILTIDDPGALADMIASALPITLVERQQMLEMLEIDTRLEHAAIVLGRELSDLEMQDDFNSQVQQEMARTQREMYLREQMRIIQTELGEEDIYQQEINEVHDNIQKANLSPEAHEKAMKELSRLAIMPPMAPEVGIIRTYLDWLCELPWSQESEDNLDIKHADTVLNDDHFGLEKVKERILEHIAVRKLAADKMKSPILCFVGPPGVGKTSMGKSIARALGREFVRVSLGGVRDESEIRGHRRTYIGALPGRIIQTMRKAGTVNPVFMLDEIDKLGTDFRGDPAAALLEVLDPEQNSTFSDHYMEVDYDLSKVLFIATANELYPMSPALEDRMEIIEFTGYTEEEKVEIARQFLIPKETEAHGLSELNVSFTRDALLEIIREYTYEAGVRNLEREIANLCRKIARQVAEGGRYTRRVTSSSLVKHLGPPHFSRSRANDTDSVGVATGLVWTSNGGDIQTIEVSVLPGKGNLTMTGQLGDVLQESAQTAMSYMRSRATDLDVPHEDFENFDVHVHMPEGSVPKEGPSAGITLAAAIISAFSERKVRSDIAMTGEITLRGTVLPVGGIKEKVLAARRNRIMNLILPADNKKDLVDIPKHALRDMNIVFVDNMQQVMDTVLLEAPVERERDRLQRENEREDGDDDTTQAGAPRKPRKKTETTRP